MKLFFTAAFLVIVLLTPSVSQAQSEVGHYGPGVMSIRDYIMPEPGFYGAVYSFRYNTKRLNDENGDEIKSVNVNPGPGPGVPVNVDINIGIGALAPTFIWASKWKILGARYGAYIAPTLGNSSIGASLSIPSQSGRSSNQGQFGLGDMFVQPLWLTWNKEHFDFSFDYGFYAPIGKYNTETYNLPVLGSTTVEASDNIGFGFWTHQFQGAASWYPWADKRMAIATAMTYEIHGQKKNFDLTPGQNLTFNWGISQFIPLQQDQKLLLEIGPTGYDSWQVTNDAGTQAAYPSRRDNVHAAGGQIGLTQVDWGAVLNFHYFAEFSAKDRFQGQAIGLNLAKKF